MTGVAFNAVLLNSAANPSDFISLPNASQLNVSNDVNGQVRAMASGSLRAVTVAGRPRTFTLTFPLSARAAITWVEQHIAQTVCVRDDRGRKVYGVYFSTPIAEQIFSSSYGDIALTITEVTFSEAV